MRMLPSAASVCAPQVSLYKDYPLKSAKLAVLALLAASLTAGSLPSQEFGEPPAPASASLPSTESRNEAAAEAATDLPAELDELPEATEAASVPATAPEPAPSPEPAQEPESDGGDEETDLGYDPVVGGGFPVPGPNTPMVTDPDGTVRSAVETDISAMHDHGTQTFSTRDGGASTMGAAARSGTINITLVYATLTDNRGAVNEAGALNSMTAANQYWRAMSNGRLGVLHTSTRAINSSANSWMDYGTMMNTIKRDLGWRDSANNALLVFVPALDLRSGGYGGILGGGWTAGPTSGSVIMPQPSGFTNNVVTHEFGHVLGLLHANSLKCTNGRADVWLGGNGAWGDGACTSREYGDTSDLMGYAQYASPAINSYFWDAGGFGRGDEIYNAGTPASAITYILRPWAGSSAQRAVKFRDTSGETYYLELRLPVGYDASTAVGGNRGVKIVKADLANNWAVNSLVIAPNTRDFAGYNNANSTWQAGQTFTTHAGSTVRIDWINGDSASVTVTGGAAARAGGPIAATRAAHPELGAATSEITGGVKDNGAYQNFQNGAIVWSPGTGARVSMGAIRSMWGATGFDSGYLGLPTSDEVYGLPNGGAYQDYQGGSIIWSPATGARVSKNGPIRNEWGYTGFERSYLGYPTSNEVGGLPNGAIYQDYQNGAIIWSPSTGARVSRNGPIRDAWRRAGFEYSAIGYPTTNEAALPDGGISQEYQRGTIVYSPASGAWILTGAVRNTWLAAGAQKSDLKYPVGNEVLMGSQGTYQDFQGGAMIWSAKTGAQISKNGPIRTAWGATGHNSGYLGLPTGPESSMGAQGTYQDYEGGAIIWSAKTGAQVSKNGPIRTAYAATGFNSGYLGLPTSGERSSNGGTVQDYEGGSIYSSASAGTHVVKNGAVRDAYRAEGAETGRLGYPTSGAAAGADGQVVQTFTGGRITVGRDGKAVSSYS